MGKLKEWVQAVRTNTGKIIAGGAATYPSPDSDYWYESVGGTSRTGVRVTQDTAVAITAIDAGVSLISDTIASLPMPIYERMEGNTREARRKHVVWRIVNEQPNSWQTAVDFWSNRVCDLLMLGNAYAEIQPGSLGFVTTLRPLSANRMTVRREKYGDDIIYEHLESNGARRAIDPDNMFHIRNAQTRDEGVTGLGILHKHTQSLGLSLAIQAYCEQLYSNGTLHRGVLTHPGEMGDEAVVRLRKQWRENSTGLDGAGKPIILEEGMAWENTSMTPEDAEVLDSRKFMVEEACRMLRVPPHLLGHTEKNSSWGTGMADLTAGFLKFTLRPWLERIEQAVSRDLILAPGRFFPEFNVEGLLRADVKTRHEVYAIGRQWGLITANEARSKENQPPLPGGDTLWQPSNMQPASDTDSGEFALGRTFIRDTVRRQVANEVNWVADKIKSMDADVPDPRFRAEVEQYFGRRVSAIQKSLHISEAEAEEHAKYSSFTLLKALEEGHGGEVLDEWPKSAERRLIAAIFKEIA